MEHISKTYFKAHALEILREIEMTGQAVIITNHGKPVLEVRKLTTVNLEPSKALKNTIIHFDDATSPVADDDWEND